MNDGRVVGVDAGRALDKTKRRQGNMIDSTGLEALLKNRNRELFRWLIVSSMAARAADGVRVSFMSGVTYSSVSV